MCWFIFVNVLKPVFQNWFSTSLQKLKVPYHTRDHKLSIHIQSISVRNQGGWRVQANMSDILWSMPEIKKLACTSNN